VAVQISDEKLAIRSYLRTRTVNANEIRAITLQSKAMGQAGNHWIPRVDLTDANTVWITNFDCGPAAGPPKAGPAAAVGEIRALLSVKADDMRTPENPQSEGPASE
jgi:hypothetical protein